MNARSHLVELAIPTGGVPTPFAGYAASGLLLASGATATDLRDAINALLGSDQRQLEIRVDGSPSVRVELPDLDASPFAPWVSAINARLTPFGVKIAIDAPAFGGTKLLRFVNASAGDRVSGAVSIASAPARDAAAALQLGPANGGLEVDGNAFARPAPSGLFASPGDLATGVLARLGAFADLQGSAITGWTFDGDSGAVGFAAGQAMREGPRLPTGLPPGSPIVGALGNVADNLGVLGRAIESGTSRRWLRTVAGVRLVLEPSGGEANTGAGAALATSPTNLGAANQAFEGAANTRAYSLGATGTAVFQGAGVDGTPGTPPNLDTYRAAFDLVDREVDLFNLLVLPRPFGSGDPRPDAWGPASAFCLQRRAFLLVDPPDTWRDADSALAGLTSVRTGLARDHAAVYWPRVTIARASGPATIDPSGSMAGLAARIDANRGVWKAPAGIEASLLGVRGVEHAMSDADNGRLNPEAVNALRAFPDGVVSWGARTVDGYDGSGQDDYKYVPVRRLALFLEESLARGLRFAVFEPNDEPLWAQIRLAAGSFMNGLFRKGAFAGQKASDAYFVKVDRDTTTQADIDLGIVNVVVGFAPLKPAEFVVITIQQTAGQAQG